MALPLFQNQDKKKKITKPQSCESLCPNGASKAVVQNTYVYILSTLYNWQEFLISSLPKFQISFEFLLSKQ